MAAYQGMRREIANFEARYRRECDMRFPAPAFETVFQIYHHPYDDMLRYVSGYFQYVSISNFSSRCWYRQAQ